MEDEDKQRGRAAFEGITGRMIAAHDGVDEGRMMSCAAVAYRGNTKDR